MKAKPLEIVDLFSGAGGASTGALRACRELGVRANLLAVNHWPTAVATHALNYPEVRHLCESVEQVNPLAQVPGGRLHLLIAAPECTQHSTARGGRPVNDQQRGQPWMILKWLQELYVENLLIENVPELRNWGPIGADGQPLASKIGQTYQAFLAAIRSLGYRVEDKILCAADYGDPTTRRRLFILAKRKGKIQWPQPSHSKTGQSTIWGTTKKWRAAREIIDWTIPSSSIFGRRRPLSPNTMRRILAGLERFGGHELQPFLIVLRHNMGARSLDLPVPAMTAGGTHLGVVEPFMVPLTHSGGPERVNDLRDPMPTPRTHAIDAPVPTIAAQGQIDVVQPFLVSAGGPPVDAISTESPMNTVLTRDHMALVEPFIAAHYGTVNVSPVSAPLPTVTTKDRFALVMPVVNGRGLDIRLRMLRPKELAAAHSFSPTYVFTGSQGDAVKQIGNSIPCAVMQALVETLLADKAVSTKKRKVA